MNIAITGEGIICAIGDNRQQVLESLRQQRSGIGEMRYLRSTHHELPVGEVKHSDEELMTALEISSSEPVSRTALLGMVAVRQALDDAGLLTPDSRIPSPLRVLLISGTTVAGMDVTERFFSDIQQSDEHLSCLNYHRCGSNTRLIADHFGLFSDFTTISTACSSAANALILGARLLEAGQADIVVAGGTEALSVFHLNGFRSLMILDEQPCRPFDEMRAGLNLGEGAAYVVMESEAMAARRQRPVHAWLRGYGNACDAFHQTASSPDGEGAWLAMTEALAMAGLQPQDIQYVNAHGTATPNNDASESAALRRVFAERMPLVSSTKSFTGHTTSASGSIEAVICLLALQHQFVPANLGWQHAMADGITPTLGEEHCELQNVVCNAFGFGGNDSSLVFSTDKGKISQSSILNSPFAELARIEITSEDELAEIRDFVKPLEARRMGKLMKSSLLSSLKALRQAGIETPDAIITATSLGCWENSEALLLQLADEGEVMLKPTYFMQSTHNTIGANIAIRTRCHGYNVTYTQDDRSLEWALRDARLLIESGRCKTVLVGLHEETTPLYRSLMSRLTPHSSLHTPHSSLLTPHSSIKSIAIVLCGK